MPLHAAPEDEFDQFLAARLRRNLEHNIAHQTGWSAWSAWCMARGLALDTNQRFTARMKIRGYGAHTFYGPTGDKTACYLGYELVDTHD